MQTVRLFILSALVMAANICLGQRTYHIIKTFHIESDGGWDYLAVSPINNELYISHSTQVNILNKNTGDSVGVINNTTGVHGIAFAPKFGKGYISDGRLNTVTVFDIRTHNVIGQIKAGENPDAIMYDDYSKKIFVCNGRSKSLTIIDPVNDKVMDTVALDGKPETAVSDNEGAIYINIEDKNEIAVVNIKNRQVEKYWQIGKGESPSGLAIDRKTKRLFAGCANNLLIVLDAITGKVIKQLPIGSGCDGVAFDNGAKKVFSSNGIGTLTIIKELSANEYKIAANVPTQKGARTLALDEKTHIVYLSVADFVPANKTLTTRSHARRATIPGTFRVLVVGE